MLEAIQVQETRLAADERVATAVVAPTTTRTKVADGVGEGAQRALIYLNFPGPRRPGIRTCKSLERIKEAAR
jgi:hypothetical protein